MTFGTEGDDAQLMGFVQGPLSRPPSETCGEVDDPYEGATLAALECHAHSTVDLPVTTPTRRDQEPVPIIAAPPCFDNEPAAVWPFRLAAAQAAPGDSSPAGERIEPSAAPQSSRRNGSALDAARAYAERFSSQIHDGSVGALRRFEALSLQRKLLVVALPYLAAAIMAVMLLSISPEGASAASSPVQIPAVRMVEVPVTQIVHADHEVVHTKTEEHALVRSALLYARPDNQSKRTTRASAGETVTLFPDFDAEPGFVLARTERGAVGFLEESVLTARPEVEPIRKKRRRRRRRRR